MRFIAFLLVHLFFLDIQLLAATAFSRFEASSSNVLALHQPILPLCFIDKKYQKLMNDLKLPYSSHSLDEPSFSISLLIKDLHLIQQPFPKDSFSKKEELFSLPQETPALNSAKKIVYKKPQLASGFSYVVPGLGHFYLQDYQTGLGLLAGTAATLGIAFSDAFSPIEQINAYVVGINLWSYGIYAAYRDTYVQNPSIKRPNFMPQDSLFDLVKAPFSWSVVKKPEVWGGFLGMMILATAVTQSYSKNIEKQTTSASSHFTLHPLQAFPIGIGEEAFFRGYLQSTCSQFLGPWGGIFISSMVFGAAHIGNAQSLPKEYRRDYYTKSIPFITLFGVYNGWLAQKNHSLKESVALHAWYDFTLFLAAYSAGKYANIQLPSYQFSLCF